MNSSDPRERALEVKVGVFVLLGLIFIGFMAFRFGRVGQGLFQGFYTLTLDLPQAGGLIKNSDVQLAGARIGYVAEKPAVTPGGTGVTVPLAIQSGIKIPRKAHFQVGSSGLLGDKFVEIVPDEDFEPAKFDPNDSSQILHPKETVQGAKTGGLEVLQKKGEEVFDLLKVEIGKLTEVTDKINAGVLSDANQKNLADTFANLKTTSEHFSAASKDLDVVVENAKNAVGTVDSAASDLRTALADARKVIDSAKTLLAKAQTGEGPVATLLNNRELSENLKALVSNLRQHGILFYKNRAQPQEAPRGQGQH